MSCTKISNESSKKGDRHGIALVPYLSLFLFALFLFAEGCARPRPLFLEEKTAEGSYSLLAFEGKSPKEGFPLLYALHFAGGSGPTYLELWKKEALRRRIMVLAPTLLLELQNEAEEVRLFDHLMSEVRQRYPLDNNRIYVVGTSLGALGARWITVNRPHELRAVAFVAGAALGEWLTPTKELTLPPLLFILGEKDPGFSMPRMRRIVRTLERRGVDVTLLNDPEAGHEHRPEWNPRILDWMESKSRYASIS